MKSKSPTNVFNDIDVFFADGHTESQMIPIINYKDQKIVFMLIYYQALDTYPPYVMGYDTRPLLTLKEKSEFLSISSTRKMDSIFRT